MANFANIVNGKDEVVILADAVTLSYFDGKVPSTFLIKAHIEDIWIRDYSPVIPSKQVKFTYLPQSQSASVSSLIDKSFEDWFLRNKLNYHAKSSITLDGGNVVDNPAGTRVIVTDRILKDNPSLTRTQTKETLEHLLGAQQVAIIREVPNDTTGHADGLVMWATNNKILLHTMAEPIRTQVINELESSFPGVQIVELPDYYQDATWRGFSSACNIFVNSIVTDNFIYMPTFNSKHDDEMLALIQSHTDKIVVPISAENVCFMGGSVRCLSWQVKGANKKLLKEIDQGIFKICSKPKSATASWWNSFARIKDDQERIHFVQCIKCLSIFVYKSNKTGSSTHKSHAEARLGGGDAPSTSKNQDILSMNTYNNLPATEACAKYCSYDLRPFETVNDKGKTTIRIFPSIRSHSNELFPLAFFSL